MDELEGRDLELRISKPGHPKDCLKELRELAVEHDETSFEYIFSFDKDHPLTEAQLEKCVSKHTSRYLLIDLRTRKILRPGP